MNVALVAGLLNYLYIPVVGSSEIWRTLIRNLWVCAPLVVSWLPIFVMQWLLLRRFAGRLSIWIAASALAGSAGALVGYSLTLPLSRLYSSISGQPAQQTLIEVALALILGVCQGLGVGITQWLMLRRRLLKAEAWIPINASAFAIAQFLTWYISLGSHPEHLVS